ncbi:hypothetical protein LPJ61_000276 [Coemansia biformis]|uniref:SAC domain-containing protein n=1 Tax=Coemansia biformis TaxID=1286918 RepID=A0A9W7YHC0_9FUNG|nr:hypothetical protein LPJ61_000276 [Coemansia biformis]
MQIRRSTLTADDTGYRLQSCDYPGKTLVLAFDGGIRMEDGIAAAAAAAATTESGDIGSECAGAASQITPQASDEGGQSVAVHAVAGIFELEYHRYVLVVTDSRHRGSVGGCDLYEVMSAAALPLDGAGSRAALCSLLKAGAAPESAQAECSPDSSRIEADASFERMELRVLDEIARVFRSGMFYSYDYDLTRSLQRKGGHAVDEAGRPLACNADREYWFNHSIQQPLLEHQGEEWALPLIQGCVQTTRYEGAGCDPFEVSVLSRRSCRRIGLRYERRGANADGDVANFVETEQLLVVEASGQPRHYVSFLQTRGSMPFLWKQPPSGLHPVPVVTGTDEDNVAVCAKHLRREIGRLGRQVLVNLVEHKGREAVVGSAYASLVGQCVAAEMVDARLVRYVPWDFHHETRGMRYGALAQIVEQLRREVGDMGYFWHAGSQTLTRQKGAFRVNCMDCLDRTNVVQSAIARSVLNEQLVRLGMHAAPDRGLAAYPGLDARLNHMWANNGDYLSRQYAGTSAMKGDFTRTGKRNLGGILNDATYSVARLWNSAFRDYFSQSIIDFLMGSHQVGDVFHALVDLQSREPGHAREMVSQREEAVRAAVAEAVSTGEQVHIACIVQPPLALDTPKVHAAANAVLLVTGAAVYICQQGEAPNATRIELAALAGIQCGAFVTDTRTPRGLDPDRNHGLVLFFSTPEAPPPAAPADGQAPPSAGRHYVACKLASEAQVVMQCAPDQAGDGVPQCGGQAAPGLARLDSLEGLPPRLFAECVCSTMQTLALSAGCSASSSSQFVVDAPIVSPAAARQGARLVDKMASRLHNALWL